MSFDLLYESFVLGGKFENSVVGGVESFGFGMCEDVVVFLVF